ncbi:hypothetical protein GCM10009069_13500 [Algimonas arctica]|uniref:Putative Flp pilus-assembly TadG-like N-terminal domain-containing protein n=1 Tax=Algimonas arctica TaxID=1479486 RepID=A0A8J3CQG5_9PROT|nr:TadE/TadG family type IV pilus assembly protein [Algimonas arctica]GHA91613.1 hypothetical protein GCM10009069_13500 [Algimonas arctica]
MAQFKKPDFWQDTNGNLSIITGVVGLLLITAVGASLDGGQMFSTKQRLQSITDAAALTATMPDGISSDRRKKLAVSSIYSHAEKVGGLNISETTIEVNEAAGQVYVSLTADVPLLFGGVLGKNNRSVSASSLAEGSSTSSTKALSISLVLDLSSSMQDRFDSGSKISSVRAAVSDVFSMVSSNFGSEAAAATRISTGVYPFNWGMVDGETVALQPGTGQVLASMTNLSLSEGSVSANAIERAVEDQIAEAAFETDRERYIVYISDGRVEHDKSDEFGRYLDEKSMFAGIESVKGCTQESKELFRSDMELEPGLVEILSPIARLSLAELLTPWDVNRGIYMSPTCKKPAHPHNPINFPDIPLSYVYNPNLDPKLNEKIKKGKHLGHNHTLRKSDKMAKRLEKREKFLKQCRPIQTERVVKACERAREEDISIIAINLAGEDGLASNVTHMCANGFNFGDKKKVKKVVDEDGIPLETEITTRELPSGVEIRVSADGQSFSGDATNLEELREMLSSMLPSGSRDRHVRLVR